MSGALAKIGRPASGMKGGENNLQMPYYCSLVITLIPWLHSSRSVIVFERLTKEAYCPEFTADVRRLLLPKHTIEALL